MKAPLYIIKKPCLERLLLRLHSNYFPNNNLVNIILIFEHCNPFKNKKL